MRTLDEHWATLKDWKEAGRVRYIGVSLTRNSDYVEMERFMRAESPDFIMTATLSIILLRLKVRCRWQQISVLAS